MKRCIRLGLVQMAPAGDLEASTKKALAMMEEAAGRGAQIVAFPEVHLSPFFPRLPGGDASAHAVTPSHPSVAALKESCRRLGVVAFPNVYLRESDRLFDASLAIDVTGELLGVSKMVHIVQVPGFHEQDYYAPSDTGFHVYDTRFGRIGVVICFDRHYPESIRTCVLGGAEIIVIPTVNTKSEDLELFEWELRVPAVQNGVFIAMCNRVGREGDTVFCGESIVVDPAGAVVAKADDREGILLADLDLEQIVSERRRRPYLELRRPETFRI